MTRNKKNKERQKKQKTLILATWDLLEVRLKR
jgi:hypothetical protein